MLPPILFSLVLLGVGQGPGGPAPSDTVADALEATRAAVAAGRGDSAWTAVSTAARAPGASRLTRLVAGALGLAIERPEGVRFLDGLVEGDPAADDVIVIEAATRLADRLRRAGQAERAADLLERAVVSAARLGEAVRQAEALALLSSVVLRRGDPPGALGLLDSAEAVLADRDGRVGARAACQRATVLAFLGRHVAADSAARAGSRRAREAGSLQDEGRCLAILGSAQAQRSDFFAAADTLALAARALAAVHDERTLAAVLQWRGYALNQLARLGEADADLRRAVRLAEAVGDRNTLAWAELNLGEIAMAFGDRGRAAEAYGRAVAGFRDTGDAWGEHSTLLLLAAVGRESGSAGSEADARLVADWAARVGNPDLAFGAWYELALQAEAAGRLELALARADTAWSVAPCGTTADRRHALDYLRARLLLARGDAATARSLLDGYLAGIDPDVRLRRYAASARRAEALLALGDTAAAGQDLEAAMRELDRWRASLDSRAFRRAVFAARADDPDPDLGIATVIGALAVAGEVDRALELAERRRARDLADQLARVAAAATEVSPERPSEGAVVAGAGAVAELMAGRAARSGGRAPTADDPPSAAEIRAALDPGTALVSFVTGRGGEPTTALLLYDGRTTAHRLPAIDSVRGLIARAVALLDSGDPLPDGLTRRMADVLVAPWISSVPGVERLVVVPEDVLHHVPFELLPGTDGEVLGSRMAVTYAHSASTLAALRNRRARGGRGSVLALADPVLPPGAGTDGVAVLPPLPGARSEVRALRRRVSSVEARTGGSATEATLKGPAGRTASLLHLATHAVVDERSPLGTFVLLAPGGREDGRLMAAEIEGLELRAEVVVLSACGTATGSLLAGEGVEGLTAPLLAAGARAVVASRWAVEDRATARLMGDFYDGLLAGRPAGRALTEAKRRAMDRGEPASVWAAFALFGDPAADPGLRTRSTAGPWLVVLLLGAAFGLGWWLRRQGTRKERIPLRIDPSGRSADTHQR